MHTEVHVNWDKFYLILLYYLSFTLLWELIAPSGCFKYIVMDTFEWLKSHYCWKGKPIHLPILLRLWHLFLELYLYLCLSSQTFSLLFLAIFLSELAALFSEWFELISNVVLSQQLDFWSLSHLHSISQRCHSLLIFKIKCYLNDAWIYVL